ncbi:MAG: hypothetical protein NTX57_19345 [Armatimonadetes bacterium]|nr:hypothetical protein [Armatimonadota bacterium]
MNVPVLIEKRSDGRVRVSGLGRGPLGWDAEGESLGEAKENLRLRIQEAFEGTVSYDTLEINLPTSSSSLDDFYGDLRDDPLYDEWQDAIAQYRQEREAA